jgi:hypothetical protein|tara:strand:+ start:246 stop:599 length:354 start_codon:yes stop_codon:yes gene_type:complete
MATNANWTIVFDDKLVIKNYAEGENEGVGYNISDDSFWNNSKFSNIWAIQHGTSVATDQVEYRDETPNSDYDSAVLGNISDFSSRWDSAHLSKLQADWDVDERDESEKGPRPTSYSS